MIGEKVKTTVREFKQKNGRLVSSYVDLLLLYTNFYLADKGRSPCP